MRFSELEVLTDLGLTLLQAKVYMALVEYGASCAKAISKNSNIARSDVYRILSKLKQLCLVEEIIKKPVEYRAFPINEGLPLLLKTKLDKYKKVSAEIQMLLNRPKLNKTNVEEIQAPQFVLVPEGKAVTKRVKAAIEKAERTIELLTSQKRFLSGLSCEFAESLEIAWTKKVKTRCIIEGPLDTIGGKQLIQFAKAKPSRQIRFGCRCPETFFAVFDKKEVIMVVDAKTKSASSSIFWSCNHSLVSLAEDYFELLWLKCATIAE